MTVTEYTFIFGLIGSLFIGKPLQTAKIIAAEPSLILWCLGIGILCTVLPYLFYTEGLRGLDTGKAGIIAAIEPLVGALLGMTVYGEPRTALKIAGIALVFTAIILLNLPSKAQDKPDIQKKNTAD
jgi:drug/metabolite transporter (DMT)-like permease